MPEPCPDHRSDHASNPDAADARRALRLLRAHTAGTLLADGVPMPTRFVLDRRTGELILVIEPDLADAAEFVFALPDDSFDAAARLAIDIALTPERDDAGTDRHRAYHLDVQRGRWATGRIAFAKLATGGVVDGGELMRPNPLADAEPALCRALNADRDRLRDATELITGVRIADPVGVGVDPDGFDVRASAGVVRVAFPAACDGPDEAARVLDVLLTGGPL